MYAEYPHLAPVSPCDTKHTFPFIVKANYRHTGDIMSYASTSKDGIDHSKETVPGQPDVYNIRVNVCKHKNNSIHRAIYRTHWR